MKASLLSAKSTLAEIDFRHPDLISATRQSLAGGIPLGSANRQTPLETPQPIPASL
jgi:hypothetical protein